jgi:hypothetical protein
MVCATCAISSSEAVIRYAKNPWRQASALAHGVVDAATHEGRSYRTRQQDRKDGVGDDGQGRTLQRTRRARGLKEITPAIRRDVKVGRANSMRPLSDMPQTAYLITSSARLK